MREVNILSQIVNGGYCIGCGACSYATDNAVPIDMSGLGMYQADLFSAETLSDDDQKRALDICPFSDDGPNEDVIGQKLYGGHCQHDSRIGYYNDLYVGHVEEGDFRKRGTSGGVITWVLAELLKAGKIDAVAHVKKLDQSQDGVLFRYGISRTVDDVKNGAKSRYYPVEMSGVLEQIRKTPGRYAVVGLPCFIKAVRRLAEVDPIIKKRVVYCIGLVCGHLKSKAFAECFGWQAGITPGHLEEIDFRVKLEDRPASHYGVYLRGDGREETKPVRDFMGCNWGHNLFRYPACDFCDDVFSETADLSVGDAWLPQYEQDPRGTSIIVVRNEALSVLIKSAREEGRLVFDESTVDQVAQSQGGGLRDRREGLAYRLWMKQRAKIWVPKKRVVPSQKNISSQRKKLYRLRSEIGAESHRAWARAKSNSDMQSFISFFNKANTRYLKAYFTFRKRIAYSVSQMARRLASKNSK